MKRIPQPFGRKVWGYRSSDEKNQKKRLAFFGFFRGGGQTAGRTRRHYRYIDETSHTVPLANCSKGNDATSTCATSPVANTLMAALPSALRAVMKPMTIYTDNTAGGSDTASYVTKSVDYLPLLAEFEIFGSRSYANSAEKNYQKQYDYYKAGNSKIKYRHNSTSSTAFWWERSPYCNGSTGFCYVVTNGCASISNAWSSFGLAPAFRV